MAFKAHINVESASFFETYSQCSVIYLQIYHLIQRYQTRPGTISIAVGNLGSLAKEIW